MPLSSTSSPAAGAAAAAAVRTASPPLRAATQVSILFTFTVSYQLIMMYHGIWLLSSVAVVFLDVDQIAVSCSTCLVVFNWRYEMNF
jgi:hypothetical protein